eukprot:COSAG06_NODE_5042_length_3766_cov_4.425689_2_plen_58_part_00
MVVAVEPGMQAEAAAGAAARGIAAAAAAAGGEGEEQIAEALGGAFDRARGAAVRSDE